ncbi:hypothetical protein GEMRC1_011438 [Eukaryota sp. GEM-RC1]
MLNIPNLSLLINHQVYELLSGFQLVPIQDFSSIVLQNGLNSVPLDVVFLPFEPSIPSVVGIGFYFEKWVDIRMFTDLVDVFVFSQGCTTNHNFFQNFVYFGFSCDDTGQHNVIFEVISSHGRWIKEYVFEVRHRPTFSLWTNNILNFADSVHFRSIILRYSFLPNDAFFSLNKSIPLPIFNQHSDLVILRIVDVDVEPHLPVSFALIWEHIAFEPLLIDFVYFFNCSVISTTGQLSVIESRTISFQLLGKLPTFVELSCRILDSFLILKLLIYPRIILN